MKKVAHATDNTDKEYRKMLLNTILFLVNKFEVVAEEAMNLVVDSLLTYSKLDDVGASSVKTILTTLITNFD